jgi:Zn-finger nucleic acid-binding protein
MDTHPYGGPGNIVVDNCEKCQIIWLDYGELKKVINAPGRDRGVGDARGQDLGT